MNEILLLFSRHSHDLHVPLGQLIPSTILFVHGRMPQLPARIHNLQRLNIFTGPFTGLVHNHRFPLDDTDTILLEVPGVRVLESPVVQKSGKQHPQADSGDHVPLHSGFVLGEERASFRRDPQADKDEGADHCVDNGGDGAKEVEACGGAPGFFFGAEVAEVEEARGGEKGDEEDDGVGVEGHQDGVGHGGDQRRCRGDEDHTKNPVKEERGHWGLFGLVVRIEGWR